MRNRMPTDLSLLQKCADFLCGVDRGAVRAGVRIEAALEVKVPSQSMKKAKETKSEKKRDFEERRKTLLSSSSTYDEGDSMPRLARMALVSQSMHSFSFARL